MAKHQDVLLNPLVQGLLDWRTPHDTLGFQMRQRFREDLRQTYICPESVEEKEGYKYSTSGLYYAPGAETIEEFITYIKGRKEQSLLMTLRVACLPNEKPWALCEPCSWIGTSGHKLTYITLYQDSQVQHPGEF